MPLFTSAPPQPANPPGSYLAPGGGLPAPGSTPGGTPGQQGNIPAAPFNAQTLSNILGQVGPGATLGSIAQSNDLSSLLQALLGNQQLGAQADINLLTGPGGQLALEQQGLGLSAQSAQQSAANQLAQYGIQGADLAAQQSYLTQQYGADPSKVLGGFSGQQQAITQQEQALQNAQQQQALRSGATAGGALNTAGTRLNYSQMLAQQGLQGQQLALSGKEQQAAGTLAQTNLKNASKSLGISEQEVNQRLNNAIAQLGLQGQVDANSVAQAVQQVQSGVISGPLAQSVQAILSAAGLPLQAFTGG